MKKTAIIVCCILFCIESIGQYKIRINIISLPKNFKTDSVFIAGSFNNWNPHHDDDRLSQDSNGNFFLYYPDTSPGFYEFKFTRGSWQKVECKKDGMDIENRTVNIQSDTVLNFSIAAWKDMFMEKPRQHTASKNVHILDTAFYMPQLNRHRRIWIYLPPAYSSSHKKYPVLYMQDGQNLFDEYTAPFGEWGVDKALDTLSKRILNCIVVGIDNGESKRMNEYNPYDYERAGKGEGKEYIDFLVKTLKPFIDKKYRTFSDAPHTFIAGSSMGGLISLYAIAAHPDIFGGAGVFSPALWTAPQMKEELNHNAALIKGKIYFYAGGAESKNMVSDMQNIIDLLRHKSKAKIKVDIHKEGKHNEANWRRQFPEFYKWMVRGL